MGGQLIRELTNATPCLARRPMEQDQRYSAGPCGSCGGYGEGQSAVCGGRDLSFSCWYPVAGSAGAFRRPDQDTHPIFTVGKERSVEEGVRDFGRRCG